MGNMKNLIIFVGAGASRGVSPEKYPMALDFRKRLLDPITSTPLYIRLIEHLEEFRKNENIDIEHILWELGRLIDAIDIWTKEKHFTTRLLTTNHISSIIQANYNGPETYTQFGRLNKIAKTLQNTINEQVYDYYSKLPSIDELNNSWLPLLAEVGASGFGRIDIATTNYDLIIESALDHTSSTQINMGFSSGILPGIDLDVWRNTISTGGMLTKLHGSVDWKLGVGGTQDNPVIRRGHPEFDGDHQKRLILYPGFKGEPTREPFIAFHNHFRRKAQEATHILFIGFAFRDEYINDLLSSAIQPNCKIAVINPAPELPSLPFLNTALHLKQGFCINKKNTTLTDSGIAPLSIKDIQTWMR